MRQIKRWTNTGRKTLAVIVAVFVLAYIAIAYLFLNVALTGEKLGVDLYQYALDVYLVKETVQGQRGTIYDKNGRPLAEQLTSYTLFANLYEDYGDVVTDVDETARQLSTVIDMSVEDIVEKLTRDGAKQVEFGNPGKNLTYIEKEAIEALELSGIKFSETVRRLYPNGVFASHTLGYTRWDEEAQTLVGDMGLEAYLNDYLTGENGVVEYLKDRYGYIQPNQEQYVLSPSSDGYDFYLTIDSTIQTFLEEGMDNIMKAENPESLVAIVMNPKTGEILAMGSRDSFDPNIRDIENYNNPLISQPFEPGSTVKIYTYAAAINEDVYEGDTMFASGSRVVNTATIRDYNQSWGTISYDEGFYRSSNTAIVDILEDLTPDKNIEYLESFGFGQAVGIALPNEYSGTMPNESDLTQKITAGFGQGMMTTPLQQVQAITAILNDGQLIQPQLIDSVYDPNTAEYIYQFETELLNMPVTASTANHVKDLMIGVVEEDAGSGDAYVLDGYTSGGKTGTAQIAGPGGYLTGETDYVYSYIGFAPAEDPSLVMYVAMDRPETSTHSVLGGLYKYVMENGLAYLGATKTPIVDSEVVLDEISVPNLLNQSTENAIAKLESLGLIPIVLGDNEQVFAQSPTRDYIVLKDQKIFLQTDEVFMLPDLIGYSKNDVILFSSLTGINLEIKGDGYVVSQSLSPGQLVSSETNLTVQLSRDGLLDESQETEDEQVDDVESNNEQLNE